MTYRKTRAMIQIDEARAFWIETYTGSDYRADLESQIREGWVVEQSIDISLVSFL